MRFITAFIISTARGRIVGFDAITALSYLT